VIGAGLLIGIILSFRQVIRLYPELPGSNLISGIEDHGLASRAPPLLAPMAAILGGERTGDLAISTADMAAFAGFDRDPLGRGPRYLR